MSFIPGRENADRLLSFVGELREIRKCHLENPWILWFLFLFGEVECIRYDQIHKSKKSFWALMD